MFDALWGKSDINEEDTLNLHAFTRVGEVFTTSAQGEHDIFLSGFPIQSVGADTLENKGSVLGHTTKTWHFFLQWVSNFFACGEEIGITMFIKVVGVLEVKSIVLLVCACYHQNHSASHFDNVPICFLLPSLRHSHLLR